MPRPLLAQTLRHRHHSRSATGVAQKKEVEIMMILDRSGSMAGTKMTALKNAANGFPRFLRRYPGQGQGRPHQFRHHRQLMDTGPGDQFCYTDEKRDQQYDRRWRHEYRGCHRSWPTAPDGFTDQTGVPGDKRIQQFVVFFSDGMPTALRDRFKYNNTDYDGVVYGQRYIGPCKLQDLGLLLHERL